MVNFPSRCVGFIEGEEELVVPIFAAIAEKYAPLLQADGCLWEGSSFDEEGRPELNLGTKGLLYIQLGTCRNQDRHGSFR